VIRRRPPKQGQDHWAHTVIPILLAAIALLACLYCFNQILHWADTPEPTDPAYEPI